MANQLDPLTFPIRGLRLIEASAGTGKTYTIGALYLRLVLGHGGENGFFRRLMPPEILVVTFTNAATEELRDRIRGKLVEAAAFFRGEADGDPFLQALGSTFPEETWPDNAGVLEQAALWMDEAAIHTIHGWCNRMLRQHAFETGSLFDLELAPDDQDLLEEAACDYWRSNFYGLAPEPLDELLGLIKCATPQALLDQVKPLLKPGADHNLPEDDPFSMLTQRRQAIWEARQEWSVDFEGAVDLVRQAQADKTLNGNKYRAASLEKWLDQLTRWVKENGPLPERKALQKLSASGLEEGVGKRKTPPVHPAYKIFDRLNDVLNKLEIDKALFVHAAGEITRRFQKQKQQQGLMNFDDLLTHLNEALQAPGNNQLAQTIADQFPVAMIDEFQDTDPVQYATFNRIYGSRENTALLMIGDPKQAIYAFRGADIHTYLQARRHACGKFYTLGTNYRSTIGLVQCVNRMFGIATPYPQGPFLFEDRIPFDAVAAKGHRTRLMVEGQPTASLHLRHLQQSEPIPKTGPEGYIAQMANAFADEIVRLLNLAEQRPPKSGFQADRNAPITPLCPADMAVLVRNGREATAIRQALDKRRVRSVYLSDKDSVFNSNEAGQMRYLLRACAAPGQERALKAALATPILKQSLTQLDRLNHDERAREAEVERFGRYHSVWQRRGVLPMLRNLLQDFGVLSGLLTASDGERSLTNFLHLAELLQEKSVELDGEQGLIRWLEEQLQQPPTGLGEQLLRLESDEELIQVITVHKAKGLQYPLVFLPFICTFRQAARKNAAMLIYRDAEGQPRRVYHPSDADLALADRERLAEDLRLLYVAVTRAQFACWLGVGVMGSTTQKGEKSTLHQSGLGYLLSAGEMIPTKALGEKLAFLKGDCGDMAIEPLSEARHNVYEPGGEAVLLTPARIFNTPVPRDWWITSYSGILKGPDRHPAGGSEPDALKMTLDFPGSAIEDQLQEPEEETVLYPKDRVGPPSIHRFPRGPDPGTFLHELLEWAANEGFGRVAHDPQLAHDQIEMRCNRRGWHAWGEVLARWFQNLLKTPFMLPDNQPVSLADLSPPDYQPELEFLLAAHQVNTRTLDDMLTRSVMPKAVRPQLRENHLNGMLKGFIDLVFQCRGRYYVLDYKSNHLGDNTRAYGLKAMGEAMLAHRYDLQYVLYTLALHRLLKARLPDYRYQRDMGGTVYLFLRGVTRDGNGAYVDKPPQTLIQQLDSDFAGKEEPHNAP
ncbi:MAG: exodeoxyribonuclease V subunit beta [Deltaproteobacteria bacterium]|nr:exodeoxyribonuclease V subunit beta [Deltaproteobacteria bacterium]